VENGGEGGETVRGKNQDDGKISDKAEKPEVHPRLFFERASKKRLSVPRHKRVKS